MKGFNSLADTSPRASWAIEPPDADSVADVVLAANVMQRIAIPAGTNVIGFGLAAGDGALFRVKLGDGSVAVAVPSATSAVGAAVGGTMLPGWLRIPNTSPRTTHFAIISPVATTGYVAFWA